MSNTIHVPDTEEIHRIAYLTMHGWEYSDYSGWSKDGFTREQYDGLAGCGRETRNHDLEQAYWAQYGAAP